MEVTPATGAVGERMTTAWEQRFGAVTDRVNRATLIESSALILDSPLEQTEFRRAP